MTPVDQKRAYNKMKHDLEPWRNVLVQINAILTWEKKFYPAIICAVISIFFLMLWVLDLSSLTIIALVGLFAVIFDPMFQTCSRLAYKTENWNGTQEAQFENVITTLCSLKMTLASSYDFIFANKERKSSMTIIITSVSLLALAWLGAVVNNLLLMYLIIQSLVLYPGMREQRVFTSLKQKFGFAVNSKIQQYREKAKKIDKNEGKIE